MANKLSMEMPGGEKSQQKEASFRPVSIQAPLIPAPVFLQQLVNASRGLKVLAEMYHDRGLSPINAIYLLISTSIRRAQQLRLTDQVRSSGIRSIRLLPYIRQIPQPIGKEAERVEQIKNSFSAFLFFSSLATSHTPQ